jgi:hypothetical protein
MRSIMLAAFSGSFGRRRTQITRATRSTATTSMTATRSSGSTAFPMSRRPRSRRLRRPRRQRGSGAPVERSPCAATLAEHERRTQKDSVVGEHRRR